MCTLISHEIPGHIETDCDCNFSTTQIVKELTQPIMASPEGLPSHSTGQESRHHYGVAARNQAEGSSLTSLID